MLQVAGNSNELAFSIVHDLRNPLSAICGCAELLVTANLDPEQTRRVAANIRRASEQMKNSPHRHRFRREGARRGHPKLQAQRNIVGSVRRRGCRSTRRHQDDHRCISGNRTLDGPPENGACVP